MKSILLAFIMTLPFLSFSQSEHFNNKNAIKISPIEFGKAEFQISYERYFGDRSSSFTLSPSIILKENNRESKEGFQIGAQYRLFLSHIRGDEKRVFLGFHNIGLYTGLYVQHLDYKEDYQFMWYDSSNGESHSGEFTKDVVATEGGALIGIQLDVTKRILIDFYIGGGIRYTDFIDSKHEVVAPEDYYDEPSVFDPEYKGVKPRIGFQLGVLF